ncbi:MAG: DUF5788 family protein [Candidatus Methanoperedens sp.]|nr:DUF5788 family protein [Candidatus Methanoperedens sp.]
MDQNKPPELNGYISPEEREHLLNGLHRYLIWVGESVPEEVEVDGKNIKLHDLIWGCIHKKELSQQEKDRILELVQLLEVKAKNEEETLTRAILTREEARRLYNDIAGLIRAIMDLRECEEGKVMLQKPRDEIKQKVDDARRWMGFLKTVGKKSQ